MSEENIALGKKYVVLDDGAVVIRPYIISKKYQIPALFIDDHNINIRVYKYVICKHFNFTTFSNSRVLEQCVNPEADLFLQVKYQLDCKITAKSLDDCEFKTSEMESQAICRVECLNFNEKEDKYGF